MAKRIVVFSDGTGNSAAKVFKTNVWRTYQALDSCGGAQIAFYDDGVGTSSFVPYAVLGGALGIGLARNVKEIYAFICRNWREGDEIYAFGFSRGAFTIRILSGLIACEGLLPYDMTEARRQVLVNDAYRSFRRHFDSTGGLVGPAREARDAVIRRYRRWSGGDLYEEVKKHNVMAPIRFLGLWDTVDAYGLPIEEMTTAWDRWFWPLTMRERWLSPCVQRACHALALDDERATFHPVLWNEAPNPKKAEDVCQAQDAKKIGDERISQVWFSGVHANVGGGYADDGLANVSLDWMVEQAREEGLVFKPRALAAIRAAAAAELGFESVPLPSDANPYGPLYDSRRGLASYYRYLPRKLVKLIDDSRDPDNPVKIDRPKIHWSVFERIRRSGEHYAPIVLPERYAVVQPDGSIAEHVYEDATQAQARVRRQESVWDEVWKRRVLYFTTLAISLVALIAPIYPGARLDGGCESPFCALAPAMDVAGALMPDLVMPWVDAFRSHPGLLLSLVAALAVCFAASARVEQRITDGMRAIWQPIVDQQAPTPTTVPPAHTSWIHRLRTNRIYEAFFQRLKKDIVPNFIALLVVFLGAAAFSRLVTIGMSAVGTYCPVASGDVRTVGGEVEQRTFDVSQACWPSDLRLVEGNRYRLKLSLNGTAWKSCDFDHCQDASLAGLVPPDRSPGALARSAFNVVSTPFRRDLSEPWFQPIARIGKTGDDEYPLVPVIPESDPQRRTLVSELTARTTGPLYLYVNDAMPFGWAGSYAANHGTATLEVQQLRSP